MTSRNSFSKVSALLSARGFRRRRHTWTRPISDRIDVVALLMSKSGESVDIVVGVCVPRINEVIWGKAPSAISESDCVARVGLHELTGRAEIWRPTEDSDQDEMVEDLTDTGLPWLDEMRDPESVIAFLDTRPHKLVAPEAAMFAVLLDQGGHKPRACQTLSLLAGDAGGPWARKALEIAASLGCVDLR